MSSSGDWNNWIQQQANILNSIASNLLPVQRLITGAAYLIGMAFAFKAIYTLKTYGESRSSMMSSSNTSLKEPLVYLFVAGIFIYFPTGLAVMLQTTFGSSSLMQYASVNGNGFGSGLFGSNSLVGRPLTIIIQTIGGIAFVRGWILIARTASSGQPPGGTGKGFIHVLGGILAMNIVATLEIINNTLYGTT
ncbi:MAG: type IV secretion protein IcmC [Tatlockia sp.]|nr:type IV secretion protein IcmC [Tatlockia sp.]